MADALFFNGQQYYTPATVSKVLDGAMAPTGSQVGNAVCFVGTCLGGQPNTLLSFSNPQDAITTLISGDLLQAVVKAFTASVDTGGAPGTVYALRVGAQTVGQGSLYDAASLTAMIVATKQYGAPANGMTFKLAAGSVSGYAVTQGYGSSYVVRDNIARNAFTVFYNGTAATANIGITGTTLALGAPAGTAVASIDLTAFTTVDQVVARINAVANFSAVVAPGASGTAALNGLDVITGALVTSAGLVVTANTQAVIDYLNSSASPYFTATRGTAAAGAMVASSFAITSALAPAVLVTDWTNAYSALQSADVQHVSTLSGNAAIIAAGDTHCQYMSNVGRKERRHYSGPVLGTTLAAAEAMATAMNSDRTAICFPGYQDYDPITGVLTTYASYQTAALVAAGFASMSPGEPMTGKSLTVRGLEATLRNPTDTDPAIQSGLLVVAPTRTGFRVVRSISTWLTNNNYNRVEVSCGAATDYAMRTVREAVDPLKGGEAGPIALARAISQAESALLLLAKPAPVGPGVIVGDANSPAFSNITASLVGDTIALAWQMSPVVPLNFITCTANIVPYSGSVSVSGSTNTASA